MALWGLILSSDYTNLRPEKGSKIKPMLKKTEMLVQRFAQRPLLLALVLGALILMVYFPSLDNGFIRYYDDAQYVTENPWVKNGLTFSTMRWAFTRFYAANWHPLTWLSHALDYQLFGDGPAGHHLTNVLLHALNSGLLFWVLRRALGSVWGALLGAALFAVHPVQVESVAWVAERKNLLSTLFWLLAMVAYGRYAGKPSWQRYGLVAVLFVLGLMSKPMVVTFPLAMLLWDIWPLRRICSVKSALRCALEKIPLLVLSVVASVVTVFAQGEGGAVASTEVYSVGVRLVNALNALKNYLVMVVWPQSLAVFYPHPGQWPLGQSVLSGVVVVLMLVFALKLWRAMPWFCVGWLWFLGTLVPVIGIVQVGAQSHADRYLYLPVMGLVLMVAAGAAEVIRRMPRMGSGIVMLGVAAVLALSLQTRNQIAVWHDDETLFTHALAITDNNSIAYNNLGLMMLSRGELERAEQYLQRAITIDPSFALPWNSLGNVFVKMGRYDEAHRAFGQAARYDKSGETNALFNRGALFQSQGQADSAKIIYQRVLDHKPLHFRAAANLAIILDEAGQLDSALALLTTIVNQGAAESGHYLNRGLLYKKKGLLKQAHADFAEYVRREPANALGYVETARLYALQNDPQGCHHTLRLIAERFGAPLAQAVAAQTCP